jgi:hypothetical protein
MRKLLYLYNKKQKGQLSERENEEYNSMLEKNDITENEISDMLNELNYRETSSLLLLLYELKNPKTPKKSRITIILIIIFLLICSIFDRNKKSFGEDTTDTDTTENPSPSNE